MKTKFWLVLAFVLLAGIASAQSSATPTSKLVWDQIAPDLATANAYTYREYPETWVSGPGTVLTPVTCTGTTSPFVCSTPFPAFTPGGHAVTMTAGNAAGESLKSTPFPFTFVVIPSPPTNLRIQ
jgi:hypothetical protein